MGLSRRLGIAGAGAGEQVVLAVRPHSAVLWQPALVLLALCPALGGAVALVPDGPMQPWLRAGSACLAGWAAARFVVRPFLGWWHVRYVVTTHRVLAREGVLASSGRDVPLAAVDDVSFTRSAGQRLLGCGDLVVATGAGSVPEDALVLRNAPRVVRLAQTITELAHIVNGAPLREGDVDDDADDEDDGYEDDGYEDDGYEDDLPEDVTEHRTSSWRRHEVGRA